MCCSSMMLRWPLFLKLERFETESEDLDPVCLLAGLLLDLIRGGSKKFCSLSELIENTEAELII